MASGAFPHFGSCAHVTVLPCLRAMHPPLEAKGAWRTRYERDKRYSSQRRCIEVIYDLRLRGDWARKPAHKDQLWLLLVRELLADALKDDGCYILKSHPAVELVTVSRPLEYRLFDQRLHVSCLIYSHVSLVRPPA